MTRREYQDKLEDLQAVVDALMENDAVEVMTTTLDDIGVGCVHAKVSLWTGIEEAAKMFAISQVERKTFEGGGGKRYFTVGGVTVAQYEGAAEL